MVHVKPLTIRFLSGTIPHLYLIICGHVWLTKNSQSMANICADNKRGPLDFWTHMHSAQTKYRKTRDEIPSDNQTCHDFM